MNPFEDEHRSYLVLRNEAGQYSLWPADIEIPGGWRPVAGPDTRAGCLAYTDAQSTPSVAR